RYPFTRHYSFFVSVESVLLSVYLLLTPPIELSMLGCVFQTALNHPLQLHFSLPVITCSSPATGGGGARTKSFKQSSAALAPAAATLLVEPNNEPQRPPPSIAKSFKQSSGGSRRSWSNSNRDRQAIILEIQKSPDIYSALERSVSSCFFCLLVGV
ncbi:hypothetical protein Tsubulata_022712, partial [Turnera subulata]